MSGSILVVGSLHYDIMVNMPKLPKVDETVLGSDVYFKCGGKGGNQAAAASQHGANVRFAGALGRDFFADALLDNLHEAGVDTKHIQRVEGRTSGMSVAMNLPDGDYGAVVASGANLQFDTGKLEYCDLMDLVLLQNELAPHVNLESAQQAKHVGAKVILNAAPMREIDSQLLELCDVLIINRVEAEAHFEESIEDPEAAAKLLDKKWNAQASVIITLANQGCVTKPVEQSASWTPSYKVDVVSSHGAGDVFVGAFAAQISLGNDWSGSINYASAAAALHVSMPAERLKTINPLQVQALLKSAVN